MPTIMDPSPSNYSPELLAKLETMLTEIDDDELLALVPDATRKSPQAKQLLLAELKKRVSPNRLPK